MKPSIATMEELHEELQVLHNYLEAAAKLDWGEESLPKFLNVLILDYESLVDCGIRFLLTK